MAVPQIAFAGVFLAANSRRFGPIVGDPCREQDSPWICHFEDGSVIEVPADIAVTPGAAGRPFLQRTRR